MNEIAFNARGDIRPAAVVFVGLALSALAVGFDLLIADAAPAALGSSVPEFGFVKVLLASVPAVLGNALGFYLSYRAPHPRALRKFLAPAAGFYLAFMVPPVWTLLAGGDMAKFAVAAALNTAPVSIAVPVLLALRPGTRAARVPAAVPTSA